MEDPVGRDHHLEEEEEEDEDFSEEDDDDDDDAPHAIGVLQQAPVHLVQAVDSFRREMSERTSEMKEALHRGTGRLYHVVTSNNWIVQFRIGVDGKLILERTVKSINLQTRKLNEARQKLIDAGKQVPISAQKRWRKTITGNPNKRIRDHMKETPQVKLLDKISFTAGVVVITFTEFLIMRHPEWYVAWFTWFMLLLFVLRYVMYKASNYHLFMLDFCYVVNISCMLQANFFPNHLAWFKANFALCMGPLCTAVLTWHNSLVFHSLEKLTSFFLHVFPPMLCHLYRWRLIPTDTIEKEMSWEYSDLILPSMGMYIVWQISYLLLTEVVYREALDADPSMITSIRWLVRDRRNPINKLVTQGCRSYGIIKDGEYLDPEAMYCKILFVIIQFFYMLLTMLPSFFVFGNYEASVGWLLFTFLIGTWNGATYYIEIFSKRYNLKFDDLDKRKTEAVILDVAPPIAKKGKEEARKQEEEEEQRPRKKISTSSADDEAASVSSSEEALAPVTPGTLSPPLAGEEEEEEPASRASTVTDDGLNLNESQAMELFQILQKLEETKGGCEGGGGRKAGQTGKSGAAEELLANAKTD